MGSVVLYYLMKYERMSLREAYEHVREKRSVAKPIRGFFDVLGQYECSAFGLDAPTITYDVANAGAIDLNMDVGLGKVKEANAGAIDLNMNVGLGKVKEVAAP